MSKTSSQVKRRYNAKTYDRIEIIVKKGQKELLKKYAESKGKSISQLYNDCLEKIIPDIFEKGE